MNIGVAICNPERVAITQPRVGARTRPPRLPWVGRPCGSNPVRVEPSNGIAPTSAFPSATWERGEGIASCSLREPGQRRRACRCRATPMSALVLGTVGNPERVAITQPRVGARTRPPRLPWVCRPCGSNPVRVEAGNGVARTGAFPNGVWERGEGIASCALRAPGQQVARATQTDFRRG